MKMEDKLVKHYENLMIYYRPYKPFTTNYHMNDELESHHSRFLKFLQYADGQHPKSWFNCEKRIY